MSQTILTKQSAPDNPSAGNVTLYADNITGKLATKDESGNVANYGDYKTYAEDEATMYQRMLAGRHAGYTWVDFDSNSIPSNFVGWAASPFVTPATVDLSTYPSVLSLTDTSAIRAFLYRSAAPTTGNGLLGLLSFTSGNNGYIGLRVDDGADQNYVEAGLFNDGTNWTARIYYRTAGGAVNTVDATTTIPAPIPQQALLNIGGTRWSNWTMNEWLSIPAFSTALAQKQFAVGPSGLTWTPTRIGITFRCLSGPNSVNVERFGY